MLFAPTDIEVHRGRDNRIYVLSLSTLYSLSFSPLSLSSCSIILNKQVVLTFEDPRYSTCYAAGILVERNGGSCLARTTAHVRRILA